MDNSSIPQPQPQTQPSQGQINSQTLPEHIYHDPVPSSVINKLRLVKRQQALGLFSLVAMVAVGAGVITNIPRFVGDVRTQASVNRPKPTPLFCDSKCGGENDVLCPKPMECVGGKCRMPDCSEDQTCLCDTQKSIVPNK